MTDKSKPVKLGCGIVIAASVAIIVFCELVFPDKPPAANQKSSAVTHVQFAFDAAGCHVISDSDAEAILLVALHNAEVDDKSAGRALNASTPPYLQARTDGLKYATTFGACSFWGAHPEQVDLLRSEANIARAQLGSVGQ